MIKSFVFSGFIPRPAGIRVLSEGGVLTTSMGFDILNLDGQLCYLRQEVARGKARA